MIARMMFAFGVILMLVGSTFAQTPEEETSTLAQTPDEETSTPTPTPTPAVDKGPLSSMMQAPQGWSMPGPDRRFWVFGDYLFAFTRGSRLPALVTTSAAGTAAIDAGVLGAPGSRTLFGDGFVNDGLRSGIRLGTGYWFSAERTFGAEAGVMVLEGKAAHFLGSSNTFPILARPFVDANTGAQASQLIAFPGTSPVSATGSVEVRASSSNFTETHFDLTERALEDGGFRLTALLGYRFYRYDESVHIGQASNPTNANFIPGTRIVTNDNFTTRNSFNGLDMGYRWQFFWDKLSLDVLTKVAVGRIERTININGDQMITAPGATPVARTGGVFALANSGLSTSHDWKAMPEAGAALNWQIRSNMSVRLGYTFILLNGVVRAADQIDTTINPHLFPGGNAALGGPNRPAAFHIRSDMWIQSVNLGFVMTY
jgi:hypothetical protein